MRIWRTFIQYTMFLIFFNSYNHLAAVELICNVTIFVTFQLRIIIYKIARIVPTSLHWLRWSRLKVQSQSVSFNGEAIRASYKVFYKRVNEIVPHIGTLIFDTVTILAHGESCQCFLSNSNRLHV